MSEIDWEALRSAQKVWKQRENPTVQLSLLTDAGKDAKVVERLSLDSGSDGEAESFQPQAVSGEGSGRRSC